MFGCGVSTDCCEMVDGIFVSAISEEHYAKSHRTDEDTYKEGIHQELGTNVKWQRGE